jgi:hypothetical protein
MDLDNTILPFQQSSFVSLDLFKSLFISFIQHISNKNFSIRKNVVINDCENEFNSLLNDKRFFECKDNNIIILFVRLNIDNDKSIEFYYIIQLINCTRLIDFNFDQNWKDSFCTSDLCLVKDSNNGITWIKNNLNNLEFDFIKIFLREDIKYIENIIIELRHPMLRQINQKAIRKFNNIIYDSSDFVDKTDILYPSQDIGIIIDFKEVLPNSDEESASPHSFSL